MPVSDMFLSACLFKTRKKIVEQKFLRFFFAEVYQNVLKILSIHSLGGTVLAFVISAYIHTKTNN